MRGITLDRRQTSACSDQDTNITRDTVLASNFLACLKLSWMASSYAEGSSCFDERAAIQRSGRSSSIALLKFKGFRRA